MKPDSSQVPKDLTKIIGLQSSDPARQRDYNGDRSGDKGRQLIYEDDCCHDNDFLTRHFYVICVWHACRGWNLMVGVCGRYFTFDGGGSSNMVALDEFSNCSMGEVSDNGKMAAQEH